MDQKTRWNTTGGSAWVELQAVTDRALAPFVAPLLEGVKGAVLDVGCGTGATTAAAAEVASRVVGVDVSAPMIEAARARTDKAEFIVADAQTHVFDTRFDHVISRFGVMFFDDPVAAFANLGRAGRHLRAIAWRGAEENPFHLTAERAARPVLPDLPDRDHDAPGQFAFGDRGKVERILAEAGWQGVELRELDVECALPTSALETYFTRIGPVGIALNDHDDRTRERVVEAVRPAFEPYVHGDEVRYVAATWLITANSENR